MDAVAQREESLREANAIRCAIADRRKGIRALGLEGGLNEVAGILENPSEVEKRMRLDYLLKSIHRMGESKITRLLQVASLGPAGSRLRLDAVGLRSREVLARHLRSHSKRTAKERRK